MVIVRNIKSHPYLEEGSWYGFDVRKEIQLPDDSLAWILVDDHDVKYMLPAIYYKDYGIQPGDHIQCRVDKINCTGKIYLEPAHPYYRQGRTYTFDVVSKSTQPDRYDDMRVFWHVRDIFGKEMHIPAPEDYRCVNLPKIVHCKVLRIKKGELHLTHVHNIKTINTLSVGQTYEFEVFETEHEFEGEKWIILNGLDGQKHTLKHKHFKDYGFETGDRISCEVVDIDEDEQPILEPEHPFYKIGQQYTFPLAEPDDDLRDYQPTDNEVIVKDIFQNLIILEKTEAENQSFPANRIIRRVSAIRRGIPLLIP
jgi:hypothetical protein